MAFQSVPETAEIVITYLANISTVQNVLQARLVGGYNLSDLTDLADAVDAAVTADWLPIQSNNVAYVSTTVRGLELENDKEVIVTTGAAAGGVAVETLPGNVTLSVKKSSGLTGRSARGRVYWIGITQDMLATNENIMESSDVTAIVAAIEAMRDAINTTAWIAVILSRFAGGVKRTEGETFGWIDSVAVNSNVDSQRRRLIN